MDTPPVSAVMAAPPPPMYSPRRILKLDVVVARTGVQASTIYELIGASQFPPPKMLTPSGRAVGWLESDIDDWIGSRPVAVPEGVVPWKPPAAALGIVAEAPKPKTLSKNGKPVGRPSKAALAARLAASASSTS
ncbi:AlpA family phage regulatory protein [Variovorax rhizosphaerae]|uniref:AlpA family phage regulatory protein n=1 Tax=Variovorax rhizosphaerae TaxID=1836200 RepID=A0ABU8WSF8_9BURK